MERRLSAILAADIAGYSRLMGCDEEGTLARIKGLRKSLVDPKLAEHHGRMVKTTGDGALIEFASAVDAVRWAVDIQRIMAARNADIPENSRIEFRVGINVGDVIVDEGDIYGDGVNVAARLEGLAAPGAICLSDHAYEQIKDRVALDVTDMGEQQLKNIARPMRVYSVHVDGVRSHSTPPALTLPSKPSIAVLPFNNMSGDPDQEYFADGMAEDIVTALSRLRWLFVVARNSSFAYKGRVADVKQIGSELGVRYVLEGSVRRAGTRVRISAKLVDSATGGHLWAERYDRELVSIFELQDEIAQSVAAAIEPSLLSAEGFRSLDRSAGDLGAWESVARALAHFWRVTRADNDAAIAMLIQTAARYPDYAPAHSLLAFSFVFACHMGWLERSQVLSSGRLHARRAVELDEHDAWGHIALGYLALIEHRTDEALSAFRRAVQLSPNSAMAHGFLGRGLAFSGRSDEAIVHCETALRLSPNDPQAALFLGPLGVAHYFERRYGEAIGVLMRAVKMRPGDAGLWRLLCASLAQAGRIEEARELLEAAKQRQPGLSIEWVRKNLPYQTPELMERFVDGLRKAGLAG